MLLIASGDRDAGAALEKRGSDRQPNPAGAAGDDGDGRRESGRG